MGKIEEIKEHFKAGKTREDIQSKGYNSSTITKAYNQLLNEVSTKEDICISKEKECMSIELQLQNICECLDPNYQYTITIKKENIVHDQNIYTQYKGLGKQKFIETIKFKDKEFIVSMLKELEIKTSIKRDKLYLINSICEAIEERLGLGKEFREN